MLANYTFLTLTWRVRNTNIYADELKSIGWTFSNTQEIEMKALLYSIEQISDQQSR